MKFGRIKMRVNNDIELSLIQRLLFKFGYRWILDKEQIEYKRDSYKIYPCNFIYLEDNKILQTGESEDFFIHDANKEYTLEELLNKIENEYER